LTGDDDMHLGQPTSEAVGRLYDEATDLLLAVMGGNIHLGYWDDEDDDSPIGRATDRLTDLVAARLRLVPGQRILDVGCGTGRSSARISADHDVHVAGVTVSAYQVELAGRSAQAAGSTEFVLADAAAGLPYPDGSFDSAYAVESLLHIADHEAVLAQIARVLRPGGRIVLADACLRGAPDDRTLAVIAQMSAAFQFADIPTRHEYHDRLAAAGMTVIEYVDVGEHVRRTYAVTAEAIRAAADGLDPRTAAGMAATAELLARFGALPDIGYALITAAT
jgi:N-methyltransferase StaMA